MGEFLDHEKIAQADWKLKTNDLTAAAKNSPNFKGKTQSYLINRDHSSQNLFEGIRDQAIAYFKNHKIPWHDNIDRYPSAHLCDSQVCCVNFLMPLTSSEKVLLKLFKRYFPEITTVLPMDEDSCISFEWIGKKNYLKEKIKAGTKRTRGKFCTSVDSAIMFATKTGKKITILIEWKYTESYKALSCKTSEHGTDRTTIYQHLWEAESCPINREKVSSFEDLFYEPFYQFTRQQFLASEIEKAHELGTDKVYLMHISPKVNIDFKEITSNNLKQFGSTATEAWTSVLRDKSKFIPVYTEDFFDEEIITDDDNLLPYWNFIKDRYGSILKS